MFFKRKIRKEKKKKKKKGERQQHHHHDNNKNSKEKMADFFGFGSGDGAEDDFFSKLSSQPQSQQPMFDLDPFSNPTSFDSVPPIQPDFSAMGQDSLPVISPIDDYGQADMANAMADFQIEPEAVPIPEDPISSAVPLVEVEKEKKSEAPEDVSTQQDTTVQPVPMVEEFVPAVPEVENEGDFYNDEEIIPGEAYVVNEALSVPPIPNSTERYEPIRPSISPSRGIDASAQKDSTESTPKQAIPMFKVPMMPAIPQMIRPVETEPKEEKEGIPEKEDIPEEPQKEEMKEQPKEEEAIPDEPQEEAEKVIAEESIPEEPEVIPVEEEVVNEKPADVPKEESPSPFNIPMIPSIPQAQPSITVTELEPPKEVIPEEPKKEEIIPEEPSKEEIIPEKPIEAPKQQTASSLFKIPMMPSIPKAQPSITVTELEPPKEVIPEEPKKEEIISEKPIEAPKQQAASSLFKIPMMPSIPKAQSPIKVTELDEEKKIIPEEPKKEEIISEKPIEAPKQQTASSLFKIPMMPSIPKAQAPIKVTKLEPKEEKKVITEEPKKEPSATSKQQAPSMYKVPMMSGVPAMKPATSTKRPRMFIPTFPAIPAIPKTTPAPTVSSTQTAGPTPPQASPSKGSYRNLLSEMPPPPPPITAQPTTAAITAPAIPLQQQPLSPPIQQAPTSFIPGFGGRIQNAPVVPKPTETTMLKPSPTLSAQEKQRMKGRSAVSFGFGGRVIKSSGTSFTVLRLEDVMKPAIPRDIYGFPGPLLLGDEQSMILKVKAFVSGKLQQKRKESGKETEVLLWELIELLCEKPSPEENLLAPRNKNALLKLLCKHRKGDNGDRKALRAVRESASDEVKRLYAEERYEDAFTLALEEGCICQAVIISQKVPGGAEILAKRVAADYIPNGDPTKLGYTLNSRDFKPTDLFTKGEDFTKSLVDNWISTIIEVAKAEKLSLMHKRAIVGELGDRIWAAGQGDEAAAKAHACYLIADFGFGAPRDPGTRISLIGWNHLPQENVPKEDFMYERFLECFEMTEIYEFLYFTREYRKENGVEGVGEERYKFFCVFQLRKFAFLKFLVGLSYERFGKTGINYINTINGMISKHLTKWSSLDQASFSAFKASFNEYAKKIKAYITAQAAHASAAGSGTGGAPHQQGAQSASPSPSPLPSTPTSPSPSVSPASLVSKLTQSSSSWFGWMMKK